MLTVSSSRAAGSGEPDGSGDYVVEHLQDRGWHVIRRGLVADDVDAIRDALDVAGLDLVVLTGGTGIGAGDVTPEAVRPLLDRELPGMAEAMRAAGLRNTPHAMLSRQLAGVIGHTLVLALPGSTGACRDCLCAVDAALEHAIALGGGEHR